MKVLKVELLAAVKDAAKAIRPSLIPIMECIKLEINNSKLEIAGSSPVMTIKRIIPVDKADGFKPVAVNMKLLLQFLAKVSSDNVTLSNNSDELVITGGKLRCKLPTVDIKKWLELDEIVLPDHETHISSDELQKNVEACIHAIGAKSNNRLMEAVYMNFGTGLSVVALDGYRISLRDHCPQKEFSLLIDGNIMKETVKILNGNVKITVKNHIACFTDTVTSISVTQTSGTYFNYVPLINSQTNMKVQFNRDELINALEAVTILKNIVIIEIVNNNVIINTKDASGDVTAELEVLNNGQDLKIGVNSSYLLDALKSLQEDIVTLEMNGKNCPIIIHENAATELVLPVNLK